MLASASPTAMHNGSGPVSSPNSSGSGVSWTPIGILMIYTLVFIVGMCFLNARSQRQPLKARSPGLLAVSSLGGYLQVIWVTVWSSHIIDLGSQEGCSLGAWSMTIGHPLLFIPYVLRCYRLHLIFNLTLEKESSATTTIDNGKYYHSRKHRISDTFLLRIMAVVFLIAACVAGVDEWLLWQGLGSWQRLYVCNYTAKSFIAVWDAVRFLETLIFTISLYKLWKVVDAFSIRMELLGVCSIWVINLMLRVVLGIYDPQKEYWVIVQPYAIIARYVVIVLILLLLSCVVVHGQLTSFNSGGLSLFFSCNVVPDPLCVCLSVLLYLWLGQCWVKKGVELCCGLKMLLCARCGTRCMTPNT